MTIHQIFILAGLGCILLELLIGVATGFDLMLIGSILVASGGVGLITGSVEWTVGTSVLLCGLYIFFGRKLLKQRISVITQHSNVDRLIGKSGLVTKSVHPDGPGRIKIDDEEWRAISSGAILEGKKAEIVGVEGVSVIVRPRT